MPASPETLYVRTASGRLAHQVLARGESERDIVLVQGYGSNLEVQWEQPRLAHFLEGLAGMGRLVLHDARGTGLSHRTAAVATLEERVGDTIEVMKAVSVEDAVVIGISGGTQVATLLAATHPERVALLVLYGAWARGVPGDASTITTWSDDRPAAPGFTDKSRSAWGSGVTASLCAPSLANDDEFVQWCGHYERSATTPDVANAMLDLQGHSDLTPALPSIQAPTLILQRTDDRVVVREHARFVAERIEGAKYVEVPGLDHWPWVGDADAILDAIDAFITDTDHTRIGFDRVLATIVFTDVVDSTPLAAELGDRRWHELLDQHDAMVRRTLDAFRGTEVKTTGDGFLATFDSAARATRWADELRRQVIPLGIELRTGVHTGEIERRPEATSGDGIQGLAVLVSQRLCASAAPNEILTSRTVVDLAAGSGIEFNARGERELKGAPGIWPIFAVTRC